MSARLGVHFPSSSFANLFEELESRKQELQIGSFGLSFNTLEQVFLRVGELADPKDEGSDFADSVKEDAAHLFDGSSESHPQSRTSAKTTCLPARCCA